MKPLCNLHDIAQAGAGEFQVTIDGRQQDIFVVYHDHKVYAYQNTCPHQGLTLNWMPRQFLNHDRTLIQCSNHDALFRIEDGVCIAGPCAGDRLSPVSARIENGRIVVAVDPRDP